MKVQDMSRTQLHRAAQVMQEVGGHFASSIARAFFYADGYNARRLVEAFSDLFETYGPDSAFYQRQFNKELA